MKSGSQFWRESASLIILANNGSTLTSPLLKVLTFTRTEKSSLFPNTVVFPGGVVESADQSNNWLDHFYKCGIANGKLNELTEISGKRPFLFQQPDGHSILRKELSLRIAAIRETFEELGLLICRKPHHLPPKEHFGQFVENFDRHKWQKIIHDNPDKFLTLCQKLNVVPDLWSLYEWSSWLTPTSLRKKRFATAFFLVGLSTLPNLIAEESEVANYMWADPKELLDSYKAEKYFLFPPQFYELSRLKFFSNIREVVDFAKKRNNFGLTLHFPIQYRCSDGLIHVLPGDDLYPENPNFYETDHEINKFVDKTMNEVRLSSKNLHRNEVKSIYNIRYYLNVDLEDGHLNPFLEISKL